MNQKVNVSVAIITKNEEKRLPACLHTLHWADEVLILDDESSDQTVAVAESFGARCLRRKMDIEGKQRNYLYRHAKHEWVLSLDADEHVTPPLAAEIANVVQKNNPAVSGYSIRMRIFIGDRWIRGAGYYPSPRLKLFRRDKFKYEETAVHPRIHLDGKWEYLKGEIEHYSFRDFSHFVDKFNRETKLEAGKWIDDRRAVNFPLITFKATDRFFRAYLKKKGFRDGYLGFILSCFSSWYQWVTYFKYCFLKNAKNRPQI